MPEKIGLQALFDDKDFRAGIERYTKKVREAEGATDKAAGEISKSTEKIGESWKKVGTAATVMGAVLTAVLTKVTLTAARNEELGIVLNRVGENIGQTSDRMREYENGVKAMGITTQASRQALIQMVQAQIDLSHSTDLARLAQDAAVIANINSSEAFERLVTTIQRGSPLMARTLGIIVDFQGAYERKAEAVGKNVDELTAAEKIEARVANVLENSAQITGTYEAAMETAGKQLRSMSRYTEELSAAMGEDLLPVMGTGVDVGTKLLKWALDMDPAVRGTVVQTAALAAAIATVGGAAALAIPKLLALGVALGPLAIATAAAAWLVYRANLEEVRREEAAAIADVATTYENYILQIEGAEAATYAMTESLFDMVKAAQEAGDELRAAQLVEEFQELQKLLVSTTGLDWWDEYINKGYGAQLTTAGMYKLVDDLIPKMSDLQLTLFEDVEVIQLWAEAMGLSEDKTQDLIDITLKAVDAEQLLRIAMDATGVSVDALKNKFGTHEERMLGIAEVTDNATKGLIAYRTAMANSGKLLGAEIKLEDQLAVARMEGQAALEEYMDAEEERAKEAEKAEKARLKAQEDALREMEQNERAYARELESLYDQIVSASEQAQADRLRAEEDYAASALKLEQDLAREREKILLDLAREEEDARREAAQKREDYARDLSRVLADLERDLAADNEATWDDYYATLERLAEKHGERMADLAAQHAAERAAVEAKYGPDPEATVDERREALQAELKALQEAREREHGIASQRELQVLADLEKLKQEELAALEEAQAAEVAAEEAAWQAEQQKAQERRDAELAANQAGYDEEIKQRQLAYDRQLEDLRIALERERAERNLGAQRDLDDLKARGVQERAELNAQHQARLAEIERNLQVQTQAFRDAYNNELSDLQTYLNSRTQQWRDHLAAVQAMLGVGSPSKWMMDLGKSMREGLDIGFAAPSLATDLQSAVASFGRGMNSLSLPMGAGGGGSSVSSVQNVRNYNLSADFSNSNAYPSIRDMFRLMEFSS